MERTECCETSAHTIQTPGSHPPKIQNNLTLYEVPHVHTLKLLKRINKIHYYLFSLALEPSSGYGLLVTRGYVITHNDASQSVGLLLDE
jgi:hypothetical protein